MRATLDQPIEAVGENARAADATIALGANHLGSDLCSFNVWAPGCEKVSVFFPEQEREVTLARTDHGYHCGIIEEAPPGTRYFFRLPDKLRPDPASRFQPETVHAASQVVDPAFKWDDQHWAGLRLHDHVLYELHVGTATQEGTFDALIPTLSRLKDLG